MVVNITGIIVDTQHRAPNVPNDPALSISMPQGGSATIRMRLIFASSAPVPVSMLKTATVPRLVVRQRISGAAKALSIDAEWDRLTERWVFIALPTKTRNMSPGRYAYDVWITMADDSREQVVPVSAFVILASEQVN